MSADRSERSEIRATDANRTAVSAALDSALDSGQLDRFEHLERVRTATRATYVSELRPLLADLQGVPVDLPGGSRSGGRKKASAALSSSSSQDDSDPDGRSKRVTRLLVAIPVVTFGLVAAIALAGSGDDAPADSPTVAIEQVDDAAGPVVLDNPGPLTLDGLQRIFSTAATASGSEVATRITAHPEHASMTWTDPEHPSRELDKSYRGGWSETTDGPSSDGPSFRLSDLDAEMIAPIIAGAPQTLGVPDGAPSHIIIEADDAGMPQYSVYASDEFHQSGYLTVNHVGEPVRMYPAN